MTLDPDLWNDDGTAKPPSKEYMESLNGFQAFEEYAERIGAVGDETEAFIAFQAGNKPAAIGDLVHFWDGEVCRAAIVMEAEGHVATLRVHIPRQPFEDWEADHDEGRKTGGSWHFTWGQCS